jgi:DNA-binding PucR family transcriptional regulator
VITAKGRALAALGPAERETLDAFVAEQLNMTRTGHRLRLHPNTIRYRLDRIAELTGRDPRQVEDLIELLCVLRLAPRSARADRTASSATT